MTTVGAARVARRSAGTNLGLRRAEMLEHGFLVAAALVGVFFALGLAQGGGDVHAYWSMDRSAPYGAAVGARDAFLYTPPIALLNVPLTLIPWPLYAAGLAAASMFALARLGGPWAIFLLLWPAVAIEILMGNIHLLLGLAIVAGMRWPAFWAFPLLTKVTPGVGVLWFAFRREWRSLAIALGTTAALVLGSLLIAPGWWRDWLAVMSANGGTPPDMSIAVPLIFRLPVAVALVWWGARKDRPALLPVAAYVALPVLWGHSAAILVAVIPLWQPRPRAASSKLVATPAAA